MQQMLRTLDDGRPVRLLGHVDDAFHPQQVGAEILLQCVEQETQRLARDRLLAYETERRDIAVVQAVVMPGGGMVGVLMMGMIVARRALLVGGGIQPGPRIGFRVGRIETGRTQQSAGIERGIVDARNACRRIEPSHATRQGRLGCRRPAPQSPDRAW